MVKPTWLHHGDKRLLGVLVLLVLLAATGTPHQAQAFFSKLKYSTEEQGKRDVLTFQIPTGVPRPSMKWLDSMTLQVTVPGILALPANELNLEKSKWIKSFQMNEARSGEEMGLLLLLGLKEASLNVRDSVGEYDPIDGALYRLELDAPILPSPSGPSQLLEGRVLTGRDGTLVMFAHTGSGPQEPTLDLGAHVVRLDWQGTSLGQTWRPVLPGGLAERIHAYEFKGKVEMEINLHDSVTHVNFQRDNASGMFIASIRAKDGMGRQEEAEKILAQRRQEIAKKQPQPLQRIAMPIYTTDPDSKVVLNGKEVDERHFFDNAKKAEQDHHYAKARGYIDRLLELFPLTKNRPFLDFYKLDLARQMDWKSGWLLTELNTLMARYPNTADYPNLRLMQLQLLNQSSQFQEASSIQWDPNLPKESHQVWLERGRTAMGLVHSKVSPDENLMSGEDSLNKVITYTRNQGPASAEAKFLLTQLSMARGQNDNAIKMLNEMSPEQHAHIANKPERLMEIADIYYKNHHYPEAVKYYSKVLNQYPTHPSITPWAILRTAESNHQLGRVDDALRLFNRLNKDYPSSDASTWGRIFQLQLDKDRDIQERLNELGKILEAIALPKDQADSFMNRVKQVLVETNRHWDVKLTLDQLAALKKDYPKIDATVWDQIPVLQKKLEQNFKDRMAKLDKIIQEIALPEALAEAYMTKAEMLGEAGRHKEVLETLNQLLTISSRGKMVDRAKDFKRHYLQEGMAKALDAGKPEYAILLGEIFGADWRDDPAFIPSRIHLAEALMRLGLHEPALKSLEGIHTDAAKELTQLATNLARGSILNLPLKGSGKEAPNSPSMARIRLDEAARLVRKQDWEGILVLLDNIPESLFNPTDRFERFRLLAKAEAGLERFPQAVQHMEDLLFGHPMGDGVDYFWYASILHKWKGDAKALPAFKRVAQEAQNKEIQALARIRIGDILQRSGDFKMAREQFSGIDALAPSSPWSRVANENDAQLGIAQGLDPSQPQTGVIRP
ncbi:MAG: tetratricopeptide repeat protein [Magnetococcus sp. YQC-5]